MSANAATCVGVLDGSVTVGAQRTYRVLYLVETTDVNDQFLIAAGAVGIPSIGYSYAVGNDYDLSAFVDSYSGKLRDENGHRKLWEVIVTFSTRPRSQDDTTQTITSYDYPWLAPARISGNGYKSEVQSKTHYSNPTAGTKTALTSSAGETYDDVYREESTLSIRIAMDYHITAWDINTVLEYVDCLNSSTFWGAPAGYYKLGPPEYQLLWTGQGLPYWSVQYDFEGRYGGWNAQQHVDEGTYYKEISTGKLRRFEDDWRLSFAGKGKLDGSGTGYRLGYVESQDRTEYWPSDGVNNYRLRNFGDLGVPTSKEDVLNGR